MLLSAELQAHSDCKHTQKRSGCQSVLVKIAGPTRPHGFVNAKANGFCARTNRQTHIPGAVHNAGNVIQSWRNQHTRFH